MSAEMQITVYGDSILKFVLMEQGRYRVNHRFEQLLQERHQICFSNRSYFGATVQKGLQLLRRDLAQGKKLGDYVLVEYGGNDCAYPWASIAADPKGNYSEQTSPKLFAAQLRELLRLIQAQGARPILCNLPPLLPVHYFQWITRSGLSKENLLRWLGDVNALHRANELYSGLAEQIAGEKQLPLLELRKPFLLSSPIEPLFCADGIHPSEAGQELIYQVLSECCDRIKNQR